VAGFPTDGAATLATSSAPVFTSASYTFVAGDVGAFIYIKSGTNWTAGWYPIASVSGGAATLTASIGAAVLDTNKGLNTAAGCATTASPTAATWGIDYSQSATSRLTFTDMVIGGTTTQFTSAANPVGKNFVGNIISNTSGTGWTVQRVAVVSTSGTTATCDKALGTAASTGGNGRMGGALASPGLAASVVVLGNTLWIKSGTYTITSASTNVSGGCPSLAGTVHCEGYGSVRGDLGARPTFIASGISTFTILTVGLESIIRNLIVDGATLTASRGVLISRSLGEYLHAQNCKNNGFVCNSTGTVLVRCSATGCSTQAAFSSAGLLSSCVAYSNTISGFSEGNVGFLVNCISSSNSGASSDGFIGTGNHDWLNCVAYNNGRHGFSLTNNVFQLAQNCIAESNGGWGFSALSIGSVVHNCAGFNNTSGNVTISGTLVENTTFITVTAGSVFTSPATGDFSLNNTASQGALLRAAGLPSILPGISTTSY
jgi:hypothetical protein